MKRTFTIRPKSILASESASNVAIQYHGGSLGDNQFFRDKMVMLSDYTSIEEAHSIIDSIPMTKGRRNALYEIREWNVDPEDVAVLAGKDGNGMIRFNSTDKVVSVSYGYSSKVYQAFIIEYEDGSKRMYGWDVDRSSYDGSEQKYWRYLGRV